MGYYDKLIAHKKFDYENIKEFCMEQINRFSLQQYIKYIIFDDIKYGTSVYSDEESLIAFDSNFLNYYADRVRYNGLFNRLLCNYSDLYNLLIINIMFHEIWHAKQSKTINDNPNTSYSNLLSFTDKLCHKKDLYQKYHDQIFIEYDAIINSIILTFEYIKNLEFNKASLNIVNSYFSCLILSSYNSHVIDDTKKYNSPVEFIKYFLNKDIADKKETELIESSIDDYTNKRSNDINNLYNGLAVDESLLKYINNIKFGTTKSNNLVDDIKKYCKSR